MLALGHTGAEYDAWLIKIGEGDQFGSGFVAVNPNSKIPALVDRSGPKPIRVFESGSISAISRARSSAPSCRTTRSSPHRDAESGCSGRWVAHPISEAAFGHFYAYAPTKIEYAIDRFAMEVKRQLDVLDRRLAENEYLAGAEPTRSRTSQCSPGTAGLARAGVRRG